MANVQDIVLYIPDVSCEHCVKTLNGALGNLPGVEAVATEIPTKKVLLRYDTDQLSMDQIKTTIDDAGYTVAKGPQPAARRSGRALNLL